MPNKFLLSFCELFYEGTTFCCVCPARACCQMCVMYVCSWVIVYYNLVGTFTICPPCSLSVSCLTSLFLLRLETLSFDTFESNGQTLLVFLYCTLHSCSLAVFLISLNLSILSHSMIIHTSAGCRMFVLINLSFYLFSEKRITMMRPLHFLSLICPLTVQYSIIYSSAQAVV